MFDARVVVLQLLCLLESVVQDLAQPSREVDLRAAPSDRGDRGDRGDLVELALHLVRELLNRHFQAPQ